MKKMMKVLCAVVFGAAVLSGCSSVKDLGRFTIISSKNVELSKLAQMAQDNKTSETDKKSLNFKVFGIPVKKVSDTYELENALDAVIGKVPGGVALVNAKLQVVSKRGFLSITHRYGYVFTGNVLYDEKVFNAAKTSSFQVGEDNTIYAIIENDSDDIKFVSKAEFDKIAYAK